MCADVIPFPRRPSQPRRPRSAGFLLPFSAAQMRIIALAISLAFPEVLDAAEAQGRVPSCLTAFLDFCDELVSAQAPSQWRNQ
jgi:hypothetical protein